MITDWDDAYANAAHIPGGAGFAARLAIASAAWRAGFDARRFRSVPHGPDPREIVELFLPEATPRGLVVFVHGGYWRAFGPADWSHLAAGALERGWAVAMPGYRLAPAVRITEITASITRAVTLAALEVGGPMVLTGHSAGGHLVARLVCDDGALPAHVLPRVARVVPISGLFDLRPLVATAMNADLRLDLAEARAESPAQREAIYAAPPVHAWVGGDERPEFVRQSALLANVWTGLGVETRLTIEPGRHHYDVIDGLAEAGSPLMAALLGDAAEGG
jgi:acetyl esterase/lipase